MSIFDSSLEPIKRMRRKARERRLLATREVREILEHRFGGDPNVFDHSPLSFRPEPQSAEGSRGVGASEPGVGILIVHGFTGSPHSMRPIAERFAALGYPVEMPLLAGHGTRWQDMRLTDYRDWLNSVESAYRRLTDEGLRVVVIGMSMGGTLAVNLSARLPVLGTAIINPYMVDVNPLMRHAGVVSKLLPALKSVGSDIAIPGVSEGAYRLTPTASVYQLHLLGAETRELLPRLKAPVLCLRSLGDHTVSDSSHKYFLEHCSAPVEFRWLTRSYHVATLDYDAEYVLASLQDFVTEIVHRSAPADRITP